MPSFWIGLLLLQFFSFRLRLFPAIGNDGGESLVLPALTLAIPTSAVIAQLLTRSLHQTLGEPYIEQVRAKGASEVLINFGHALRNAAIPTLTMLGILVGNPLAGAVVSETVFSRAGIGRLTVTAVNSRDIPVVQTLVVLAAAIFVITSLLVDLIYPLVGIRASTLGATPRPRRRIMSQQLVQETRLDAGAVEPMPEQSSPALGAPAAYGAEGRRFSLRWASAVRPFVAKPGLVLSVLVLVLVILWALVPTAFSHWPPDSGVPSDRLKPPSAQHWFGTDSLGRDLFSRVVDGSATSLAATAVAVSVGLVAGSALGLLAGYLRGWMDDAVMRAMDVLLAIPSLLLSLALITVLGFGTINIVIAVGVASVANFARIMRAESLRVGTAVYVEAARSAGVRWYTILLRHILPNAAGPVLALSALEFGMAVLSISSLSFLGFGAPPPAAEWGSLVAGGRDYLVAAWWLVTLPGVVIAARRTVHQPHIAHFPGC